MKWAYLFIPPYFLLILSASFVLASNLTNPTTERLTQFVVIGDMPYSATEHALLEHPDGAIAAAIRALNPPVLIHLGDFKKSRQSCANELFKERYQQIFNLNPYKTVYTPGDNDWTDCDRFNMSVRYDELERLNYLRQLFFHHDEYQLTRDIPDLIRQEDFIENALWKIDQIILATLHIPGTNNARNEILRSDIQNALNEADFRDYSNEKWLHQLFQAAESAQAVVIAFHADIYHENHNKPACTASNHSDCDGYKIIRELIKKKALHFKKPVLVIHGDTQAYCINQPYSNIPNLWRLNAPGDYKYIDASQIIFNPEKGDMPFQVSGVLDKKPPPTVCDHSFMFLN